MSNQASNEMVVLQLYGPFAEQEKILYIINISQDF